MISIFAGPARLALQWVVLGAILTCFACAPITPLPGGGTSMPMPPSSSGGSSGGSPPSGGSSGGGQSGGQSGGQTGSQSGGGSGGSSMPGGGLPGGGMPGGGSSGSGAPGDTNGGLPGGESGGATIPGGTGTSPGSGSGMPGSEGEEGEESDPTWEIPEDSGGGGGDGSEGGSEGGWQTSNEIPGTPGAEGDGEGESGTSDGDPSGDIEGVPGSGGEGASDAELEGALKDFDGEILAERDIIRSSSPGAGSGLELPTEEEASEGSPGSDAQVGGPLPPRRAMPPTPAPPRRGSEAIPDDIPDATDDDIIARQLREAAMQEEDPVLKDKLWEEYRKYKKG